MSNKNELLALAQESVSLAKKFGANEALARTRSQRRVSFRMRDGELEQVEDSTAKGLEIDLYVDGRYSLHRTSDLRPASLSSFLKNAVEMTRFLEKDSDRRLIDSDVFQNISRIELDLIDNKIVGLNRDQRWQACKLMDEKTRGQKYVISASSSQSDALSQLAMASSHGFAGVHEITSVSLYCSISMEGRQGRKPSAGFGMTAVHLNQLYGADKIAKEALNQAYQVREMDKGPSLKTTMVVDRMAGARILSQLLRPANAQAVFQKQSFWRERLGKKVLSSKLTIQDHPLLPRTIRSRHFDSEALPSLPLYLVQEGTMENIYVDPYYGRKLQKPANMTSTSNILVQAGRRTQEEILAIADKGVFVTSWIGGNMDSSTGDFSFGIQGFMIEKGRLGRPVSEMNVTGNIIDLFANLVELGNDPWRYSFSGIQTPTMAFENVQFSGA